MPGEAEGKQQQENDKHYRCHKCFQIYTVSLQIGMGRKV